MTYETRLLTPDTWDDFAELVEANNGVWGGCWCIGFHPEGLGGTQGGPPAREARAHGRRDRPPGAGLRRRPGGGLVPVRQPGRAAEHQEREGLREGARRPAGLAYRVHLHWQ
ncbi:MAG: hypothetical protein V9F04_15255 [Dermatophilaceae bacterium]